MHSYHKSVQLAPSGKFIVAMKTIILFSLSLLWELNKKRTNRDLYTLAPGYFNIGVCYFQMGKGRK